MTTVTCAGSVVFTGTARPDQFAEIMTYCAESGLPVRSARYTRGHATIVMYAETDTGDLTGKFAARGIALHAEPEHGDLAVLSARERDLLGCFAAGMQMKEAAREMGITTNTAREYWLRAKRKLGVRSFAQAAVLWSLEFGLSERDFSPTAARQQGLIPAEGSTRCM